MFDIIMILCITLGGLGCAIAALSFNGSPPPQGWERFAGRKPALGPARDLYDDTIHGARIIQALRSRR